MRTAQRRPRHSQRRSLALSMQASVQRMRQRRTTSSIRRERLTRSTEACCGDAVYSVRRVIQQGKVYGVRYVI